MKQLKGLLGSLNKRKVLLVIFASIYFVGIILGRIIPTTLERNYYLDNAVKIFINTLLGGGSPFTLILNRLFTDLFCLILFYVFSVSCYLVVCNGFVIFYKGYLTGAVMVAFISGFGFTGLVLFLLVVFLENLISTSALIILTVLPLDFTKTRKEKIVCDNRLDILLFACVITVLGILLQILMLFIFFRPMNYIL